VVLIRALVVLLAISGCSESLFGVHSDRNGGPRDGGDGGDDASVPDTCPASCIADAAASFDGSVGGAGGRWRYLGDKRDRTWAPMLAVAGAMVGDANNRIERCADKPSSAACTGLPGALLVTSSGTSSTSDPAIEYTAPDARVIQLALHVYVPGDSVEHRVRLYRNSREDVLFTASASPGGATVAHTITVDALPGDRFLVALEPSGGQGGTAALHLFVIDANKTFPSTCQLAVTFSAPTIIGPTIDDLCGGGLTSIDNAMLPAAPLLVTGPFAYQGMGGYLDPGYYLYGSQPLDRGDTTIQFWVQNETPSTSKTWVFSDIDEVNARGLGIGFKNTSGNPSDLKLEASVVSATSPVTYTGQSIAFANPQNWRFVRVVHTGGVVTFCLDGARVMSFPLPGPAASGRVPYFGKNGASGVTDYFGGSLDDVRVFSDALPCNE
jgi:3D (Asp-Asp-Asp) domain-containing protein